MSVNPALTSGPVQGQFFPAPYQGEFIFANREKVDFYVDGLETRHKKFKASGSVFLSNLRMVFVAKKLDEETGIHAIELPLMFITDHDVKQPIFGANNLTGKCQVVDNATAHLNWKLYFTTGGMGTLVPLFYSAVAYMRNIQQRPGAQYQDQQQQYQQEEVVKVDTSASQYQSPEFAQQPPAFVSTALVDPSDPTKIYTTNQVSESERLNRGPQYPVV